MKNTIKKYYNIIIKIILIAIIIFLFWTIIDKIQINKKYFESLFDFLNTNIGTAIIGLFGVVIGSIISYYFNKYYQNKRLKKEILEKTLSQLLEVIIISLKQSSNVFVKQHQISDSIEYFKNKTEHTVNNKIQLDLSFKDYYDNCKDSQEKLAEIFILFETHQIILSEFENYHKELMKLCLIFINKTNELKDLYNNKIYVSLHKINLSKKYIDSLIQLENGILECTKEIQFHLGNLTTDIQNVCYGDIFKNIKVEKDTNNNYKNIKLKKGGNKIINFSNIDES